MAVPSYGHDLTDWIADGDVTAWTELTGAVSGGAPDEADTESALQGTNSCSQTQNTTGLCSMVRILATPVTFSAGQVALVWQGHAVATALLPYASSGLRIAKATDVGNWGSYDVGGNDVAPHPYGKWVNNPVDFSLTPDATTGTPPSGGTNIYGIASMCQTSQNVAKGQPHVVDIIRYGRAEARITGGSLADGYATFSGYAAVNDAQTARWGLIQQTTGGYLWKGLMNIGYNGTACQFVDSNKNIYVQDCRKVTSGFNKIEIRTTGTVVNWDNIAFLVASPSTTASKGALEVVDDVSVTLANCQFVDMDTFIFKSNSSVSYTIFRRCGQVTLGGATVTGCTFARSTAAVALACGSSVSTLSYTDFISSGTGHAIEITSGTSHTLTGITFSGYAATSGSTGNEAVYVNIASGNVTIYADSTFSYRTAGATVTIVAGARTATVTVATTAGTPISGAFIALFAKDGTGDLPYKDSVTITHTTTTATVSHTAHGMLTNDKVLIEGANEHPYNGVYSITKISDNSYSYTMDSDPGANATGTITATWTAIYTTSDVNGEASVTRVFSTTQPVVGWARKSTTAPYYQTGSLNGSISTTADTNLSTILLPDE